MNADFLAWLASLTNDDGSGTNGDLLNISWFDAQMDTIDGVLTDMEAEIAALQAIGFIAGYDSVLYAYTDADTITIASGGQFTTSDSTAFITVAANTALKLSTGRSTDCAAEAANTLYYIWGGLTALGATAFYFHTSATAMPSELTKGKRMRGAVRNNNSSDIMPFVMTPTTYWYDVNTIADGNGLTEVLDAPVSTTWTDVLCSGFVPSVARSILVKGFVTDASTSSVYFRAKGSSVTNGVHVAFGGTYFHFTAHAVVNDSGVFQVRKTGSGLCRLEIVNYQL